MVGHRGQQAGGGRALWASGWRGMRGGAQVFSGPGRQGTWGSRMTGREGSKMSLSMSDLFFYVCSCTPMLVGFDMRVLDIVHRSFQEHRVCNR